MNDVVAFLEQQEQIFTSALKRLGNPELSKMYSNIQAIRRTVELMAESAATPTPIPTSIPRTNGAVSKQVNGFVLTDAVREAVRRFGDREFTVGQLYQIIQEMYPEQAIQRDSASATVSNLSKKGDLDRVYKGSGGNDYSRYRAGRG